MIVDASWTVCVCLYVCVYLKHCQLLSLSFFFPVSNGLQLIRAIITHCQNVQKKTSIRLFTISQRANNIQCASLSFSSFCMSFLFIYFYFFFSCCRCADDIGDFIYTILAKTQFVRNWEMKKNCVEYRSGYKWRDTLTDESVFACIWLYGIQIRAYAHTNTQTHDRIEWMFLKKKVNK